jgi:hypothetical protein
MSPTEPRALVELRFYEAAQAYLRALPPEHFMEATRQATQRKIFLESADLIHAARPEVQAFNELLVQWTRRGKDKETGQVVPDNMVVVWPEPIQAEGSYDVPLQPARPFWVLEYVSKSSKRKDHEDSFLKYERELKVPYYLLFYPDNQELTLFHHNGRKYVSVKPNGHDRRAIPEIEVEVALLDGWVRFWFRGELVPLPADLQRQLDATRAERDAARAELGQTQAQLDAERRARSLLEEELARLKAQLGQARGRPGTDG